MWILTNLFLSSEEAQLRERIKEIVANNTDWRQLYSWTHIKYEKFYIFLESQRQEYDWLCHSCFVNFDERRVYNMDEDESFLSELWEIVYKRDLKRNKDEEKNTIKQRKEHKKKQELKRTLLISEALASLSWQTLQKVSEKVKDEWAPVFAHAKRVEEITKELREIHSLYTI